MILDPVFYLVAIPAVLLTGVSKGGFGGALGGIAVPLMASVISPRQAAGILLPILCLTDLFGLRLYFGKWDRRLLSVLLPGALVGVTLGTLAFGIFNESSVRLLIGVISVLFVVWRWFLPLGTQIAAPSRLNGVCMGGLSGFASFVAHAGGPPVMIYLLPQRLDKTTYIATMSFFFLTTNAIKLVPYASLGQLSNENLLASLALAPLVPIGMYLGNWLQKRVNHLWFYRIAQTALLVTGLQLIYQAMDSESGFLTSLARGI
ncbi:sulfite exporter TauE/SafE family protein [Noviherbaspirillum saxi]|uniref:Probable membrane transporter protein n=1 Tax=Noviherbaspirillum saxi TaxID=2320863 RepID=A0A3A3FHS1_9BURK|nr:sulfite exporter TauE/SafE family protein [Noviherbaspirillum saxi]RJF92710.1 sulfite exporter TauE/SafE family protein [Noviherbaspirillum saxi]